MVSQIQQIRRERDYFQERSTWAQREREREREQANKVRGAKQIWEVPTGGTSPKILEV
jgi:hypothetical protein